MLLEKFIDSNAWDSRFNMPTCPMNNNPWIYSAYAQKLMKQDGHLIDDSVISKFFDACSVPGNPGLFHRWPNLSGGTNSHDEILGAAYLSRDAAKKILDYLDSTDGVFSDLGEKSDNPLHFNVYRMIFVRPFLVARAYPDQVLGVLSQYVWSGHIFFDAFTHKAGDAGGALRNWIMFEEMSRFPICQAAIVVWKMRMNRLGLTPKTALAMEPHECPVYADNAPVNW